MRIKNVSSTYRFFGYAEPSFGLAAGATSGAVSDDLARNEFFRKDVEDGIIEVTEAPPSMSVANASGTTAYFSYATPVPAPTVVHGRYDNGARMPDAPVDLLSDPAYLADKTAGRVTDGTTFRVSFTATAGGTLDGTATQNKTYGADCTAVTAVPDEVNGYHFVGWTGDAVSTDLELTVLNVTRNMNVRAVFAKNTYVLSYGTTPGGSVWGDTMQTVEEGADGTPVVAVPHAGYVFNKWWDGAPDEERQDTEVTEDLYTYACFEYEPPEPE